MKAEATGKYRLYKKKTGIAGQVDLITGSEKDINEFLEHKREEHETDKFKIYKEEQVIYKNSQTDGKGNFSDSIPTWRNVSI
jgi:hypothetical protein